MAKKTQTAWISALATLFPTAGTPKITAAEQREALTNLAHSVQWVGGEPRAPGLIRVINQTTTTPPGSPADDDAYVVEASATGDWAAQDGKIAIWDANVSPAAWTFYTPEDGWLIWDLSQDSIYRYDTGASPVVWTALSSSGSINVKDDGTSIVSAASALNFTGGGVTVTDAGGGQANVAIGGGVAASRLTASGSTSLLNSTVTTLTLGTVAITGAFRASSPPTNGFKVPAGVTHVKLLGHASIGAPGSNPSTVNLRILKNTSTIITLAGQAYNNAATIYAHIASGIIPVSSGDTFELAAFQNGGTTVSANAGSGTFFFEIEDATP